MLGCVSSILRVESGGGFGGGGAFGGLSLISLLCNLSYG